MKVHDPAHVVRLVPASLVIASVLFSAGQLNSTELVQNGDFSQVLVHWDVDDTLGDWNPYQHPAATVNLHPNSVMSYQGSIITQPLNVTGIANQSVNVSIDLTCDWTPPPGNTVAVYLDYLDNMGIRQRGLALNPDNQFIPEGSFGAYSNNFVFPADASALVGVSVDKLGEGWLYCDNVSVTSPTLVPGPVPHLHAVSPSTTTHNQILTISGDNFGTSQGEVRIGGSSAGLAVQSWSPSQITVMLGEACTGGNVQVEAGGMRTCETRELTITSPHFTLELEGSGGSPLLATAGQQVQLGVRTAFRAGFGTATGIQLACTEAPSSASFSPNPVTGDGGSVLTFDTTGLSPGIHSLTVTGTEASSPQRSNTFQIDLRQVGDVTLTDSSDAPIHGMTFTSQTPVPVMSTTLDTQGNDLTFDLPNPQWSTTNTGVIEVIRESTPWGQHMILPHNDGTATIRATMPDGSQHDFDVTVSLPTEPRVISHACTQLTMSNDPTVTNTRYFHTTGAQSSHSWSISDLGLVSVDSGYTSGNTSYYHEFSVGENQKPGTFWFSESSTVALSGGGSASVSSGCMVHVANDPTTGMITGHVTQFGGDMFGHGANGDLEFYDATTGDHVFTQVLWEWTANYSAVRIPPGTYKVRLNSGDFSGMPLPQWFPNANDIADADTVTVVAGETVPDINFTLSPPEIILPAPPVVVPPHHDAANDVFSLSIQPANGTRYEFQKSSSMLDGSWFTLQNIWGDDSVQLIEDNEATSSSGYYRFKAN